MLSRLPGVILGVALGLFLGFGTAVPELLAQSNPQARIVVITNFDTTEVQINGVSYPYEWVYGNRQGMTVPANQRFEVVVSTSPEQRRTFRMRLDPGETRVLMVDIENMGASPPATVGQVMRRPLTPEPEEQDGDTMMGTLGVSSSPRGMVFVDGVETGEMTPARRIPAEPGRHEVQVYYVEEDIMSEVKHVLIRAGVNTNVFFRLRREQMEAAD